MPSVEAGEPSASHVLAYCIVAIQSAPTNAWQQHRQQQAGGLHIGLRVAHARRSSPALHPKALAAAGFGRPGTSIMSSGVCAGSRASSSRGRSRSLRRPGTAPAAAPAAAAEEDAVASSMYRVWVPELHPAVADSGLHSSRDVLVRFVAEGSRNYVVKPYTRCATRAAMHDAAHASSVWAAACMCLGHNCSISHQAILFMRRLRS